MALLRNGWEAAEAQALPLSQTWFSGSNVPVAHCSALDPGQDQSEVRRAQALPGRQNPGVDSILSHPFKSMDT